MGRTMSEPVQPGEKRIVDEDLSDAAAQWFECIGRSIVADIDRLWPHEDNPAYRAACLAEEAGEVNRAITKRRHAYNDPDLRCKGKTPNQWTEELRIELAQALGVIIDIAEREGFDLVDAVEQCAVILRARKAGS